MSDSRRDLPRIELDFPAAVVLENGALIHLAGHDISRGGMGLGCDPTTAQTMVVQGSLVAPSEGAEFNVQWELPNLAPDARTTQFTARTRLAWSKPARGPEHRLGLQFVEFAGEAQTLLDTFVVDAMR